MNIAQKPMFLKILLIFILSIFSSLSFSVESSSDDVFIVPPGGVPGQIDALGEVRQIYFPGDISVDWSGSRFVLKDQKQSSLIVNFEGAGEKTKARELLGESVEEQDLGGSLKKKAPLAFKNPKVRNILVPKGGNPLKELGMQPSKVVEGQADGGKVVNSDYPDGSKSMSYTSPNLKEENTYNRFGVLTWRNIEGEDKGVKFRKTQWEDGSTIQEYSRPQGTLSVVYDVDRDAYTYSFLNSNRELIKEIICQSGSCEEN